MKKILILFIALLLLPACAQKPEKNQVCFQDNCFEVTLAKTAVEREQGLMFRESLSENTGMLFVFPDEKIQTFWMKNTLIPLDIIFLDKNKKVVDIKANNQTCDDSSCELITSSSPSQYVLELNASSAQKIGLKTGDYLILKNSNAF